MWRGAYEEWFALTLHGTEELGLVSSSSQPSSAERNLSHSHRRVGPSQCPEQPVAPFRPPRPPTKTAPSPIAGRSLLWKEKSLRKQRDGFVNIKKRRAGWAPDVTGHQPELTDTDTCPEGTIIIALILCPCQSPPSETLCIRKEHLF